MLHQLRSSTRTNQGMNSRNGSAGNRDKNVGPPGTGDDGTAAVNELRREIHLDHRVDKEQTDSQSDNNTDLHEGAKIVTGCKK